MFIKLVVAYLRLTEDLWYWLERRAGDIWYRFCPDDKASYWLDWLPAWTVRQRFRAHNWRVWLISPDRLGESYKPPFFIRWLKGFR